MSPTQSDDEFLQQAGIEPQYAFVAVPLRKILAGIMGIPKDELTTEFTCKDAEQRGMFLNYDVNEDIYIPLEEETSQSKRVRFRDRGECINDGELIYLPPMQPVHRMFTGKVISQGPVNFGEWFRTVIYFWLPHAYVHWNSDVPEEERFLEYPSIIPMESESFPQFYRDYIKYMNGPEMYFKVVGCIVIVICPALILLGVGVYHLVKLFYVQ